MRIKNLIEGLNAQQRSVPQLPAMAKAKHISVLGAKTDPKHPFAGYMVGADESAEPGKKSIGPDRNDPYEKGWRAQPDATNPYVTGTPEHQQWQDGRDEREAQPNHYDESVEEDSDGFLPSQVASKVMMLSRSEKDALISYITQYQQAQKIQQALSNIPTDMLNIIKSLSVSQQMSLLQVLAPSWREKLEAKKKARLNQINSKKGVAENKLDEKCWDGYEKKGMKTMFGKRVPNCVKNEGEERNELDTPAVQAALAKMAERHKGEKWSKEQLAALGKRIAARGKKPVKEGDIIKTPTGLIHRATDKYGAGEEPFNPHNPGKYAMDLTSVDKKLVKDLDASMGITYKNQGPKGVKVDEAVTKEDIITKLKARLGDYLSDLSKEIKSDPDLVDKLAAKAPGDQMGPPVKTVTTDDGHEIQIHGNEDDGFRISIKNKQSSSKFNNLDEAVMACEMYCAQRRKQAESADYVEEAGKDACYHKVKSRYKIWPSAYASGALVRCRKVGADNWGNKSKK